MRGQKPPWVLCQTFYGDDDTPLHDTSLALGLAPDEDEPGSPFYEAPSEDEGPPPLGPPTPPEGGAPATIAAVGACLLEDNKILDEEQKKAVLNKQVEVMRASIN